MKISISIIINIMLIVTIVMNKNILVGMKATWKLSTNQLRNLKKRTKKTIKNKKENVSVIDYI